MKRLFLMLCLFAATASADLMKLTITQGHTDPMPIALPVFEGTTDAEKAMGEKITAIIKNDLESTGLFYVIPPESFIEQQLHFNVVPRFQDWKIIKTQALVNGFVKFNKKGQISVGARLWDIFSESEMKDAAAAFQTEEKFWRRIAHIIADMIYKRLTGEDGYFDTRIVYINKTHMDGKNLARLAIMDQDGANHKLLTNGNEPVLSPRFAPSMQKIAYMTFVHGSTPKVFVLDLETGKQNLVGTFPGLTFAPRFAPGSDKLIMSQALDGSSSLYEYHIKSGATRRLTKVRAIDTSPSYSPDGKNIVFNSDRSGAQHLFVMDQDGANVKRISFGQGRYATPVWSPRGDLIAFTKIHKGQFYIGVMKTDGSDERLIATGYLVEGPTWAPNGRTLMYWKESKPHPTSKYPPSQLYAIDITGGNERLVKTPGDATHPAWSPPLPLSVE